MIGHDAQRTPPFIHSTTQNADDDVAFGVYYRKGGGLPRSDFDTRATTTTTALFGRHDGEGCVVSTPAQKQFTFPLHASSY